MKRVVCMRKQVEVELKRVGRAWECIIHGSKRFEQGKNQVESGTERLRGGRYQWVQLRTDTSAASARHNMLAVIKRR